MKSERVDMPMIKKTKDAISRSDRVLVAAMAIVLATASAAVGASLGKNPRTDQVTVIKVEKPVVRVLKTPAIPEPIALRGAATDVVLARLLAEHRCLAEVMYYEARGEGEEGQKAVAEVVFHRMNTGNYGHSICAVVYEGADQAVCQFSFACDAARILTGEEHLNNATGDAVNFHTAAVQPGWSAEYVRTVQIGNHIFYRRPGHLRINGA
jgi:hypothetical protein